LKFLEAGFDVGAGGSSGRLFVRRRNSFHVVVTGEEK